MLSRRGFLAGIIAAGVAPAIVRPGLLMPVKPLWRPIPWGVSPVATLTQWGTAIPLTGGDLVTGIKYKIIFNAQTRAFKIMRAQLERDMLGILK